MPLKSLVWKCNSPFLLMLQNLISRNKFQKDFQINHFKFNPVFRGQISGWFHTSGNAVIETHDLLEIPKSGTERIMWKYIGFAVLEMRFK